MHASDYLENKLQDFILRGRSFTPAATLYLALFTVAPTDAGGGTECSASGYARVAVPSDYTSWTTTDGASANAASTGTGGECLNINDLTFPTPGADWGTVVAMGLFDASTSGNMYFWAPLVSNKVISNGQAGPVFPAEALSVTCA